MKMPKCRQSPKASKCTSSLVKLGVMAWACMAIAISEIGLLMFIDASHNASSNLQKSTKTFCQLIYRKKASNLIGKIVLTKQEKMCQKITPDLY